MQQTSQRKPIYNGLRNLLPSAGNVIFTVFMIGITLWAQSVGAISLGTTAAQTSVSTIPYQGFLTDVDEQPLTGAYDMKFCLYDSATGGTSLWCEQWNGANQVQLNDGLFNVSLGSLSAISSDTIANGPLFLGVTIGTDNELTPRAQIGSGVYAMQVPDGSITQQQAPFAPIVYRDGRWIGQQTVDNPIVYTGWFLSDAAGQQTHDLSAIFNRIDSVQVTQTGNNNPLNHITFAVTNADGTGKAIPSEVKISAMGTDGTVKRWVLLMFGSMMTATTAHAQSSENYHMPWYSADSSGGGFSTGNGIKLYSNVGQSIVGNSSSSNYKLTSGYGAFFRRDTRPLVMIIASLDNDLGQYWEQVINSAEKALDGGQHVRILIDGPGDGNSYVYDLSPDSNNFCPSIRWNLLCGRYEEGINRWTWTEDVSHPVSLYRFMTEAMDAYPHADSVTLSLIGHGSGWGTDVLPGQPRRWREQPRRWREQSDPWPDRPDNPSPYDQSNGFLWDDFTGEGQGSTASSISDLRLILEGVLEHTGRKIDLLYFDACSMGMAEVAYELRDTVRYLLVSESTAWATFAYDQMIGAIKRGMDGQEIGEAWLKVETDLLTSRSGYPFVLGLYDQSKLQDLAAAMQKLSQSLGTVSTAQRDLIIEAVTATERVESNYNGTVDIEDSYVDLKHFVEQISAKFSSNGAVKGDAEAVKEAINQTVVRKESKSGSLIAIPNETRNFDNAGGISFYFPSHQDERKREFYYNEHHLQWTNATGWGGFLDGWHGTAIRAARSSQTPEMPTCNSAEDCEGLAKPLPGPIPLPSPNTVCISSTSGGEIQGLPFRDEDILCHSPITDEWTLVFDGSKQKLPKNADVNAFHILDDGSILISFDRPFTIAGLGKIDDSDIVLYIPPANGNGRGTWKRFFTGKNAQLTKGSEDIDGLFQTADGRIVVTFIGTAKVTGVSKAKHPDMLVFTPASRVKAQTFSNVFQQRRGTHQSVFITCSGKGQHMVLVKKIWMVFRSCCRRKTQRYGLPLLWVWRQRPARLHWLLSNRLMSQASCPA